MGRWGILEPEKGEGEGEHCLLGRQKRTFIKQNLGDEFVRPGQTFEVRCNSCKLSGAQQYSTTFHL